MSFFAASIKLNAQQVNTDSLRKQRQHVLDSTRAAQKKLLDSTKAARTAYNDSIKAVRKAVTDSLATIRAYKQSKHYKDSVTKVRQRRLDSIKTERSVYNDSLKQARQHVLDSTREVQKAFTDSIRLIQKHRADSLGAIRAYRQSKRYKDSTAITRQQHLDSIRIARQNFNDSIKDARKQVLDSVKLARKQISDSITTVRKARMDSITAVRKVKADSLAKKRAEQEKLRKSLEKKREQKMQLALELKIKKKHEAWNNEKMLKKKWSLPRKVVQNTFTRYNYYFNANKKMDEALENMQRMRKENLDSMIALFPFNPDRDSSTLAPDMDSIIQKASLGIQIHDPRTKWNDDLYLLMGEAYYYKGNYDDAISSFRYIISINQQRKMKEQRKAARNNKKTDKDVSIVEKDEKSTLDFLKHKTANNDAVLWMARTYTQAHKEEDAESILDLLDNDKNLTESLKGRIALEKANLNLGRNNYKTASENLTIVANDHQLPNWIRLRAAYLNGQILNKQENYKDAAANFQQVIDMNPKLEMDFYARKNLAFNELQQGGDNSTAISSLKKLLKDGKYAPYYEQVYYILGRLAANNNQHDDAITYLKKSVGSAKSTKKQKALSFSSLGNVYYGIGDYHNAKLSYDSAAYLAKYAPGDSMVITAIKRAGVLDKVAYPSQVIHEQDSLLALSEMSEKEQKAVVRRYIHTLEQARADSIAQAENGGGPGNTTDAESIGSESASWYFSNSALMQQGFNEFKRKWGNRPNVDDWNRNAKLGASATSQNAADQNEETIEGFDENGIPTELSLLACIPSSEAQKKAATDKLERAYLDLGSAYIFNLNDYPRATQTLDTFDKRFPNSELKAEDLYLQYQLALKKNDLNLAQSLSDQLRRNYGDTKWATLVGPTATEGASNTLTTNTPAATYYEEAYNMMMQRDYVNLLERAKEGQKLYKEPAYKKRLLIMEAIALAGTGSFNEADTLINDFITKNPKDSLRMWADAVAKYIKTNKPAVTATPAKANDSTANSLPVNILTNPNGNMAQPTQNASASSGNDNDNVAATSNNNNAITTYSYDPKKPHIYLFYFYKMESKTMGVKVALNDFNTFNYSNQHLKSNLEMFKEDQGIISVKTFPSAAAAKIYKNAVNANSLILKEYKSSEYQTIIISEDNFTKLEADKDILPYLNFYKKHYK